MTQNQIIRISLKTLAIKARVYNIIRTALFNKRLENITDQEKIEFFDKIFVENKDAHQELNAYKRKRQDKAKVIQLRKDKKLQQQS